MAEPEGFRGGSAYAGSLPVEEVAERAARLGITVERIVEELRAIAFADITHIISWDAEKLTLTASDKLDKADRPAIAEIIASAKDLPREIARQDTSARLADAHSGEIHQTGRAG